MATWSEIGEEQGQLFDKVINNISQIPGVDIIYFLSNEEGNFEIIQEFNKSNTSNYLEQISSILKAEPNFNNIGTTFYTKSFHTYTFLNETGLIIISKVTNDSNLYMIIIAGENEPVDLINVLKICKETRLAFTYD